MYGEEESGITNYTYLMLLTAKTNKEPIARVKIAGNEL